MKLCSPASIIAFFALIACVLDLARACWYDVEMLSLYWVPPFLFGLVLGITFATVVLVMCLTIPSSSGGKE